MMRQSFRLSCGGADRRCTFHSDNMHDMDWWMNALWSITPTVLIGILFAIILRLILRADRTERRVYDRMEAEERRRLGLPPQSES